VLRCSESADILPPKGGSLLFSDHCGLVCSGQKSNWM